MNSLIFDQKVAELKTQDRNFLEPCLRESHPDWIRIRTGEPHGKAKWQEPDGDSFTIQLKAKMDLFIRTSFHTDAILCKGAVVQYFCNTMMGAKFALVFGDMWTRGTDWRRNARVGGFGLYPGRLVGSEPWKIVPYRLDMNPDGSVNHGFGPLQEGGGRRTTNWFVNDFRLCGYGNTYPNDDGLFHRSMWDIQYLNTTLYTDTGAKSFLLEQKTPRTLGTYINAEMIHPCWEDDL